MDFLEKKIIENFPSQLKEIINIFKKNNWKLWIVGGAIRDTFYDKKILDYDLLTNVNYENLSKYFKIITISKSFPIMLIIYENIPFQVSLLDNPDNLISDWENRDFTINAIYFSTTENKIININSSYDDLKNKLLKTPINYEKTLNMDKIRYFRAIRFLIQCDLKIDDNFKSYIKNNLYNFLEISKERIYQEYFKLFNYPLDFKKIKIINEFHLFETLFPELNQTKNCTQNDKHQFNVWHHTNLALFYLCNFKKLDYSLLKHNLILDYYNKHYFILFNAILLHDIGKPIVKNDTHFYKHEIASMEISEKYLEKYNFPKKIKNDILFLIKNHMRLFPKKTFSEKNKLRLYNKFKEYIIPLAIITFLDFLAKGSKKSTVSERKFVADQLLDLIVFYENKTLENNIPKLIDGNELMHIFKLKPGKEIGFLLKIIREKQLNNELETKNDALIFVENYLKIKNN